MFVAGCTSGFKPLRTVPTNTSANRPAPPEAPVYGVSGYQPPQVWLAPLASPREVDGQARAVEPAPEPAEELLALADSAAAAGDLAGRQRLLQQAADAGNAEAHYRLARILQTGEEGAIDMELALAHLSQADALGYAEASRVLAWNYLLGIGVQSDRDYARRLMEKAARRNDRALRELALLYLNAFRPGLDDPARGLALLDVANRAGDIQAGRLHRWFSRAPARGTLAAGPYAEEQTPGLVSVADGEMQAEAIRREALAGDSLAMYRYAEGLLQGRFPSLQGEPEGYAWLVLAKRHGNRQAEARLAELKPLRESSEQASPGLIDSTISDLEEALGER